MSAERRDLESYRAEFRILESVNYLNSCSLGALSRRSLDRLDGFLEEWHTKGASAWYVDWLGRVEELRERVARFLNVPAASTALLPSTSAALSVVAESHAYGRRDRVVTTELDFPTLLYQWAAKPEVELVVLPSHDGIGVEVEQFAEAVDERTAFLATSHVYFTTGYVQDIEALARVAHDVGARCLIDAYQGPGQIEVDLGESDVDVYTTGPLKWLLGGPGLSYLYVRPELVTELEPRITSWFASQDQFDFDPQGFRYRDDARRFELGTPALPTVHTALGGQELIDEVGMDRIAARNRELTDHLVGRAEEAGFELRLADPERRSNIVMIASSDPPGAVRHLAEHDVIVDYRPGYVRVSPHFYNLTSELDHCVEVLSDFTRQERA